MTAATRLAAAVPAAAKAAQAALAKAAQAVLAKAAQAARLAAMHAPTNPMQRLSALTDSLICLLRAVQSIR